MQVSPVSAHSFDVATAMRDLSKRLEARIRSEVPMTELAHDQAAFKPGPQAEGGGVVWRGPDLELETAWAHVPALGHRSHHVNAWVAPTSRVPHLSIIVATTPLPFLFIDLLPRVDMVVATEYLDAYYGELDSEFRALRQDTSVTPFVMGSSYLRLAVSPSSLCFTTTPTPSAVAKIDRLACSITEDWLSSLKRGDDVPAEERAALSDRDQKMRLTIARRDPGPTGKGGCTAS